MREGEGDDLAGIAGIGQDLLIPGHRGIEAYLADRGARGTQSSAPQHRPVGKNQNGGRTFRARRGGGAERCTGGNVIGHR